ncbi:galactosyl transferase GMA12/MNN10 family protein [Penicillium riverlandense]|uniref:galactosyl transferase GMA12/MNN10 family protein n=1 Tax=Penicillium riverlandense TaxID=1903569 RepID=UPI002547E479|nr:galactosyl transferase GMA12/MNN10 family protein [Penicillium riverlandense]KAJ5818383.1 galactosyl transferase GMA12/MNN10 family protein [Penicillium riverlandense]
MLGELEKPPDQRLEWLFWFDSDTVLMNLNLPLETFLPPSHLPDVHILLSQDYNGLNNGIFLIRVHPWSVKLLNAVIAYPYLKPDVELHWDDQSALSNILKENEYFGRSTVYCPQRWFNPYTRSENGEEPVNKDLPSDMQVHPGDLLVHFPGTPSAKLNETMGPYIAISEEERPDWNTALEDTGYIEETALFWENYRHEL